MSTVMTRHKNYDPSSTKLDNLSFFSRSYISDIRLLTIPGVYVMWWMMVDGRVTNL